MALLVVVAALVGGVPGTTHAVWQLAACALHTIMQFVVVEVCASRMPVFLFPAGAPDAKPTIVSAAKRMMMARTGASQFVAREPAS